MDRVWAAHGVDLARHLVQAVDQDPMWRFRPELSEQDVVSWMWARAQEALPAWLRGPSQLPRASVLSKPPVLFPLVKSKCFSAGGLGICGKAGHSCMRRVIDTSKCPGALGFRVLGRAV